MENGITMSKGRVSVPLYFEKHSVCMRALVSDGNQVVAAVDAQGQESSSAAIIDTTMLGPAALVEEVTTKDVNCSRRVESKLCV